MIPNNFSCHNYTMPTHNKSSPWQGYRSCFQIRLHRNHVTFVFSVSEQWAQSKWSFTPLILPNICCLMLMDFKCPLELAFHVSAPYGCRVQWYRMCTAQLQEAPFILWSMMCSWVPILRVSNYTPREFLSSKLSLVLLFPITSHWKTYPLLKMVHVHL